MQDECMSWFFDGEIIYLNNIISSYKDVRKLWIIASEIRRCYFQIALEFTIDFYTSILHKIIKWDILSDPEYYFKLFVFVSRQNTKNLRNLCFLSEKKTDWRFKGRYILHTNSWGSCDSRYSIKTCPIILKYYRNIKCVSA